MSDPVTPPDFFARHARLLAGLALAAGLVAAVVPYASIPAFLVAAVVTIALAGKTRMLAAAGLVLALAGFVRFVVKDAAPAIVLAGQRSAEEKAISRLREILWAEDKAQELGLVKDAAGTPQALFLGELLGLDSRRRGKDDMPLLRDTTFSQLDPAATKRGIFRADSYLFVVYLPNADGAAGEERPLAPSPAPRRFLAYAWPNGSNLSGSRVFFLDEEERICEADVPSGLGGPDRAPDPFAAFAAPALDAVRCPPTGPLAWRPWRHKAPRVAGD